jgi:hypothetical protein
MKKIDLSLVPAESGGTYPSSFDQPAELNPANGWHVMPGCFARRALRGVQEW